MELRDTHRIRTEENLSDAIFAQPRRLDVAFDEARLVADAGLVLPATVAHHLGRKELVEAHLDLGRRLARWLRWAGERSPAVPRRRVDRLDLGTPVPAALIEPDVRFSLIRLSDGLSFSSIHGQLQAEVPAASA